jgi:rhamnosyltransferase
MFSITAVIPVKNGYPEIRDCIEGLLQQTIKLNRILVIDSGSTDGTLSYLEQIKEVQILHIDPAEFNHGKTRNLGWQNCSEEYLLYTVQDAKPVDCYFLEEMLKGFLDEEVAAVCGQQVVPHDKDKNPVDWFRPYSPAQILRYQFKQAADFISMPAEQKKNICGWDDVAALYKSAFLRKQPFEETSFGEDMVWAKSAMLNGFAIVYNQQARVYHYHLENAAFTFKRKFTTFYLLYKQLGYTPIQPTLSIKARLSILKAIVKSGGGSIKYIFSWYKYNLIRHNAALKAFKEFMQSLQQGDDVLDARHQLYCGKPPVPPKNI